MNRGELVSWGALLGGVTGYFTQKAEFAQKPGGSANPLLKAVAPVAMYNASATGSQATGLALATAEGAAVGAALGWLFGGGKK